MGSSPVWGFKYPLFSVKTELMTLPVPIADEVKAFKKIYEQAFKTRITDAEALELATQALQLHYVKHYAILPESFKSQSLKQGHIDNEH